MPLPSPQEGPEHDPSHGQNSQFEIEDYRQILEERRFVMTRYMQALWLYLALSGYGLSKLLELKSATLIYGVGIAYSLLNVVAFHVAGRFRGMARVASLQEMHYVEKYKLSRRPVLYWGYWMGILVVILSEAATVLCVLWETHYRKLDP
jgi:hypothetical protein